MRGKPIGKVRRLCRWPKPCPARLSARAVRAAAREGGLRRLGPEPLPDIAAANRIRMGAKRTFAPVSLFNGNSRRRSPAGLASAASPAADDPYRTLGGAGGRSPPAIELNNQSSPPAGGDTCYFSIRISEGAALLPKALWRSLWHILQPAKPREGFICRFSLRPF